MRFKIYIFDTLFLVFYVLDIVIAQKTQGGDIDSYRGQADWKQTINLNVNIYMWQVVTFLACIRKINWF